MVSGCVNMPIRKSKYGGTRVERADTITSRSGRRDEPVLCLQLEFISCERISSVTAQKIFSAL